MRLNKIRYSPNGRTRGSELGPVQVRSSGKNVLFWPRFLAGYGVDFKTTEKTTVFRGLSPFWGQISYTK